MNIGFDAKRAYHNFTGLGNYSRLLMTSMMHDFPSNHYLGFNPKKSTKFSFPASGNYKEIMPSSFIDKMWPSVWRSKWMSKDIASNNIELYHGLSNELPFGIEYISCKKIVSIHDLIFEHYPQQYKAIDVKMYHEKFYFASKVADKITAISQATKDDLIKMYGINAEKIDVCYQACDERFLEILSKEKKQTIAKKYSLPTSYFIAVGSIIERKNLLGICEAIYSLKNENIHLVVIGKGKEYKTQIEKYIDSKGIKNRVHFLEDNFTGSELFEDLPALYQLSKGLIYPSKMEGFGIPIVEAYASQIPVITSNVSSLKEVGEGAAILVNPNDADAIAQAMLELWRDAHKANKMVQNGVEKLSIFNTTSFARSVMDTYLSVR